MLRELVAERVKPEVGRHGQSVDESVADQAAPFAALVQDQLADAYRLATVILGDPHEAEDVVHDAFERAWRSWPRLREAARADAWFRRILVNACRDRLRRRRRWRLIDAGRSLFESEHPPSPDVADLANGRLLLERGFEALSPDQRVLVALRYEEDLSVPAIAALLGTPEGTIKSRLHHALRRLRNAIQEAER